MLRVGDLESNVADAVREAHRLIDHLRGEVDAHDGSRHGGGRSGAGTGSASHVEHPIRCGEVERGERLALNRVAPSGGET